MMGNQSAFPVPCCPGECKNGHEGKVGDGMTLRQYYAAKAMQALIASGYAQHRTNAFTIVANEARCYADALLMEVG